MRRLANTEIPTYVCTRAEWGARRVAGALGRLQMRDGYAPTIHELQCELRVPSKETITRWLHLAASIGLVEHRKDGSAWRVWQLPTRTDLDARQAG